MAFGAFGFGPTMIPSADPDDIRRLLQQAPYDPLRPVMPSLAGGAAPPFAANEAQTQALERSMGMVPPTAAPFGGVPELFNRAPMGPAQSFSPPAGAEPPMGQAEPPLPPRRPSFGFGVPSVPAQAPAGGEGAARADLPAPGAVAMQGQAPASAAASPQAMPDWVKAWQQVGNSGIGGDLMAMASGLLSAGGGAGWAAGFGAMQANRRARSLLDQSQFDQALKTQKYQNEAAGRASTRQSLISSGRYTAEQADAIMASAAAGDDTALKNAMGNLFPKDREAKEPEASTLSPGQVRFDATGRVIASLPDRDKSIEHSTGLRKEIQGLPSYKNYSQALPIYDAMSKAAGTDSKAADLDLVYGFAKILDPTSVVRESESVMVRDTAALPDWLVGTINGLNGGQRLQGETRAALMKQALGRMQAYEGAFQQDRKGYSDIVGRQGLNPDDVLPNFAPIKPWEPPAKPGSGAAGAVSGAGGTVGPSGGAGVARATPPKPKVDEATRFQQLLKSGMPKAQAYEQMRQEGY